MAIRECVRKNSMLPKKLVIRNEKEFKSVNLDTLLSTFNIQRITCPTEHFLIYERVLLAPLRKLIINVLEGDRFKEENQCFTTWYLNNLKTIISVILYQVYDRKKNSALGRSPREFFNLASTLKGLPNGIGYDEQFIMLTLPQIEKKIFHGKGIRVGNVYYWTKDFKITSPTGRVMVKYDPLNKDNVFAYLKGNWKKLLRT
jgi:putative transposase